MIKNKKIMKLILKSKILIIPIKPIKPIRQIKNHKKLVKLKWHRNQKKILNQKQMNLLCQLIEDNKQKGKNL